MRGALGSLAFYDDYIIRFTGPCGQYHGAVTAQPGVWTKARDSVTTHVDRASALLHRKRAGQAALDRLRV
jgi:hypothetical protein